MRIPVFIVAVFLAGQSLAADRPVTDDLGRELMIPDQPQRIVVMHEPLLGIPLMDLGVNVVGAYGRDSTGKFASAQDFVDTVLGEGREKPEGFGAMGQIDLEKLRALKPDLIVGTELDRGKVELLSAIAPVYLQKATAGSSYGFSAEKDLALLLKKTAIVNERLKTYDERLAVVKAALGKETASKTYVAILLTDQINLVGDMSGAVQALEDLGYKRLAVTQSGSSSALGSTLMMPISAEAFGKLNPDLLVVMNSYTNPTNNEEVTRASLEKIIPGWERFLKPAREGRVVFLSSMEVTTPSIPSALHTLDAINAWASKR